MRRPVTREVRLLEMRRLVGNPICLGLFRVYRDTDTRVATLKIELLIVYLILYSTFRRILDQVNSSKVPLRLETQGDRNQ